MLLSFYFISIILFVHCHCSFSTSREDSFLSYLFLSVLTEENRNAYKSWIVDDHRHIVAVLEDLPSCKPPLNHLLELLPRLQCRYYSISSSSKQHKVYQFHTIFTFFPIESSFSCSMSGHHCSWRPRLWFTFFDTSSFLFQ